MELFMVVDVNRNGQRRPARRSNGACRSFKIAGCPCDEDDFCSGFSQGSRRRQSDPSSRTTYDSALSVKTKRRGCRQSESGWASQAPVSQL